MNNYRDTGPSTSAIPVPHQINSLICAAEAELTSRANKRGKHPDFVTMGGGQLSAEETGSLGVLSCTTNWTLLYAAVNTVEPISGFAPDAIELSCFVTDGLTSTAVLSGGKLWKRNRSTAAILLFPQHDLSVHVNAYGGLTDRKLANHYHDHGYDLARDALLRRMSSNIVRTAVISTFGKALVVHDLEMISRTHEFA